MSRNSLGMVLIAAASVGLGMSRREDHIFTDDDDFLPGPYVPRQRSTATIIHIESPKPLTKRQLRRLKGKAR